MSDYLLRLSNSRRLQTKALGKYGRNLVRNQMAEKKPFARRGNNAPDALFSAKRVLKNGRPMFQPVADHLDAVGKPQQRVWVNEYYSTREEAKQAAERNFFRRLDAI